MIFYKTQQEIKVLHQGGKILAQILDKICCQVKPGVFTAKLEEMAINLISQAGGRPAFKNYDMGGGIFFPSALCVSINNEVVHGSSLPDRIIKSGDIVNLDIGMEWPIQSREEALKKGRPFNEYSKLGGFYTDTCRTVPAGNVSPEAKMLLEISEKALNIGIKKAIAGNTLDNIGCAIEEYVEKNGLTVVRDLVGHGVGYFPHEAPHVFNYEIGDNDPDNMVLKPGMVIAIEPMINQGRFNVKMAKNGYTVLTSDGLLSSHFEHSVAILEKGNLILTKL